MNLYAGAMMDAPTEAATRAWTRLNRAQHAAQSAIESALKRAGLPPLVWYDVLWELERGPEAGLRPFELERRMLLPQYGLSRLIDRIAQAGYVERLACEGDGRGQILRLTPAGREMRARTWPVYAAAIEENVGRKLNDGEATQLARLLDKLLDRAGWGAA